MHGTAFHIGPERSENAIRVIHMEVDNHLFVGKHGLLTLIVLGSVEDY